MRRVFSQLNTCNSIIRVVAIKNQYLPKVSYPRLLKLGGGVRVSC